MDHRHKADDKGPGCVGVALSVALSFNLPHPVIPENSRLPLFFCISLSLTLLKIHGSFK